MSSTSPSKPLSNSLFKPGDKPLASHKRIAVRYALSSEDKGLFSKTNVRRPPGPRPPPKSSPGIWDTPAFSLPFAVDKLAFRALDAEISSILPSLVPAAKGCLPQPS